LLVVYAGAIGANLWRGRRHIDCGCGLGSRAQPISLGLIARNALLIGLCGLVPLAPPLFVSSSGAAALIVACAATLLLCQRIFETLLANGPALERLEAGAR
jgi:hypothetical protein